MPEDMTKRKSEKPTVPTKDPKEELDRLLNNGVSRSTPGYDTINIYKHC